LREGDIIMVETNRCLLVAASICTAAAVLLTGSTAAVAAIPPPEGGVQLPPAATPSTVLVEDLPADEPDSASPDEQSADSPPSSPRIVQIEKSWIETWALGGRRPLSQAGPPRSDNRDCEEPNGPAEHESRCDENRPDGSTPRIMIFGGERRDEQMRSSRDPRERPRSKQADEHWPEIRMILKSYNDLIEFYETQGQQEQAEQALRERIDVCSKLAELRMLAEFDGPGAAMQEYYRYIDRPDRALELDLHNMDREIEHLEREKADVEAQIARLSGQYDILERRIDELRERLDQRAAELAAIQEQMHPQDSDDADSDDDEPADLENDPAPPKRQMKETALTALPVISLRLLTLFLL
jgi:hypothetical protein